MGETIHHPKPDTPNGHPGIDFGWGMGGGTANSASDGKVKSIVQGASEGELWDVTVSSGLYELRYKELKSYNQALRKGSVVKKGDLIGIPGTLANGYHWELASVSILRDRFCPMTYFDEQSRQLMNSIWDSVRTEGNEIKQQFPDICSGDYKNKVD